MDRHDSHEQAPDGPQARIRTYTPEAIMSPLDILCPHCKDRYAVDAALAGKGIRCRSCHGKIRVPGTASESGRPKQKDVSPIAMVDTDLERTTEASPLASDHTAVRLRCPHCGKAVKGMRRSLGKSVRCPLCGKPFQALEETPAAAKEAESIPSPLRVPQEVLNLLPEAFLRAAAVLPLGDEDDVLVVVTSDPHNLEVLDKVRFIVGRRVRAVFAPGEVLQEALVYYFGEPTPPVELEWYRTQNAEKAVREVVVLVPPGREVAPRVRNLDPSEVDRSFLERRWAALTQFYSEAEEGPFVFLRAEGGLRAAGVEVPFVEKFRGCPLRLGFAFSRLKAGGLFSVLVHVECPEVESRMARAAAFASHHGLESEFSRALVEALLARPQVELCFTGPGKLGPCTGFFGVTVPLPDECRKTLNKEWENLCQYHQRFPTSPKQFRHCLQQFERHHPSEETPILDESGNPIAW